MMKRLLVSAALVFFAATQSVFSQCTGVQSATVTPTPNGTCVPGTVYTVCYTMNGYNQLGANWVDGFEVNLTGPWVPGSLTGTTTPANCNGGAGQWMWANSVTGTASGAMHGPGYYFDNTIDGNPGNDFGDNGPTCSWTMCFQVTVGNTPGANLSIGVTALSDGEVGSWSSTSCNGTNFAILDCIIDQPCGTLNAVVSQDESCAGNNDGQATASMVGGTPPISYSWNSTPVQNTATANNLPAGTYTVTATDGNGCTLTEQVTINNGGSSDATINNINATNTLCEDDLAVQITTLQPGGTFSGTGVNSTGLFDPASANLGVNTITYTTGGVCPDIQTIDITVIPNGDATITDPIPNYPGNLFCVSDPAEQLNAVVTGGTWTGNGVSATGLFDPALAGVGNHAITYSIANPCGDTDVINITVQASTDATINNINAMNELCENDAAVQVTTVQAGGTFTGPGISATGLFDPATANIGINTITYTITGSCPSVENMDILVIANDDATINDINNGNIICLSAGTVQLTTAQAGGTWTGTGVNATGEFDPAISGLGTQTITYSFAGLCGDSQTIDITVNDLNYNLATTPSICTADNGTATVTPTTGTAPYTYLWSDGQSTQTAIDLPAGNYTVDVTDAGGCTLNQPAVVLPDLGNLTASISNVVNVSCNGLCDATATASGLGGTPPYIYAWDDPSIQLTPQAIDLCAGVYNVGVADANGCVATEQITITEPTVLSVTTVMDSESNCGLPDGSATATPVGGTVAATFQYSWNSTPNQTTATATGLTPGTYTVTVTDDNNCTATADIEITQTAGFTASISSFTDASCFAICDGTATVAITGGSTAPLTYSWNTTPAQTTVTATGLCAGTYDVVVTDAVGCTSTTSATISEPTEVVSTLASDVSTICIGESATLSASSAGGTAPYSNHNWTASPADVSLISTQQNPTVSPVVTTTYTYVNEDVNGCGSTAQTIIINVLPALSITVVQPAFLPDTAICPYDFAVLNLEGVGGDGNYSFYLASDLANPIQFPMQVQPNATTTYDFVLQDGCTTPQAFSSHTITVHSLPTVAFSGDNLDGCHEHTTVFTDLTSPTPVAWNWNFSDASSSTNSSTSANPSHQFSSAGLYDISLSITTAEGCVADTTYSDYVEVYPLPYSNFVANPEQSTLLQGSIDFTDQSVGNIISWDWNFGDGDESTDQNVEHVYTETGTFSITQTVTTAEGCTDFSRSMVTIDPDFMFYVPNAFSPNDDGKNDYFRGYGDGVKWDTYELFVYNRWGEEIYYTNNIDNPWDGTFEGKQAPLEVYVWKIHLFDQTGEPRTYRGRVTLTR